VEFEARHHVPIPFSEVTFDWKIIKKENISPGVKLKILLVAVPNRVLHSYNKAAAFAQVDLDGMEAEIFGLIRSSIPEHLTKKPVCLVDIGWETTTISIAENGSLRQSHSFDISAKTLTNALCEKLNVGRKQADALKRKYGLTPEKKDVFDILVSKINLIAGDIRMTCEGFTRTEGLQVDNVILAGGTASLFGFKEYIGQYLKKNTQIADPFAQLSYPSILKKRLKELGSSFGVAIGVAMRGVET
jgi:type IV pilus assembly protein PilM